MRRLILLRRLRCRSIRFRILSRGRLNRGPHYAFPDGPSKHVEKNYKPKWNSDNRRKVDEPSVIGRNQDKAHYPHEVQHETEPVS